MNARSKQTLHLRELRRAQTIWGTLEERALLLLKDLLKAYGISVNSGDVQLLDGKWYITHSGLLRMAQRRRCSGIRTTLVAELSDPAAKRWVFKATVYKQSRSAEGLRHRHLLG